MNILVIIPSLSYKNWTDFYIAVIIVAILIVVFCAQRFVQKHLPYFGVLALFLFNLSRFVLIGHKYDAFGKVAMYIQGYLYGTTQGVVISKIQNVSHKILAISISFAIRYGCLVGILDREAYSTVTLFRQFVIDTFVIFMYYSSTKTERRVFRDFFENRDELVKFKQLLADSLPQSVTILDYNTRKLLFSNNTFINTFNLPIEETGKDAMEAESALCNRSPTNRTKTPLSLLRMDPNTLRDVGSFPSEIGSSLQHPTNRSVSLEDVIIKLVSQDILHENVVSIAASYVDQEKSRTFDVVLKKIKWDGCGAIAVILNDITYQENLIALKVANINKDKIIATVSHELRTPLHGIIGLLEISQAKVQDTEVQHHLSLCKDNANLLQSLVNSILDLQQLSAGKLVLNFSKINMRKTLTNVIQLFKFQCDSKKIELDFTVSENVPNYIVTDENRLKQILINLIGNAIKFTFKGGVNVEVSEDKEDKEFLQISVSDTGIGIKEADKVKLFKMYGKLEDGESVNKNGVGLGLTISNSLAGLLSGKDPEKEGIELTSEYGVGSKFSFKIHKDLKSIRGVVERNDNQNKLPTVIDQRNMSEAHSAMRLKKNSFDQDLSLIRPRYHQGQKAIAGDPNISCEVYEELESSPEMGAKLASYVTINKRETIQDFRKVDGPKVFTSRGILNEEEPHNKQSKILQLRSSETFHESGFFNSKMEADRQKFIMDDASSPSKGYIMVVDDNPFNLLVAKSLIRELGYFVKAATGGLEAIEIIKNSVKEGDNIKVIFMDCQMPIMDGFETTRSLRRMMDNEEIPVIPILAWTANNGEEDVRRCYECGMAGHLMKPTTQAAISKAIPK